LIFEYFGAKIQMILKFTFKVLTANVELKSVLAQKFNFNSYSLGAKIQVGEKKKVAFRTVWGAALLI